MNKLNWGCGSIQPADWINVDKDFHFYNGTDKNFCSGTEDMQDDFFDVIVAHASLQMVEWHELVNQLKEFHRLLKLGGVLRISLPDIDRAIDALEKYNRGWFPNTGEVSVEEAFCAWLTWYSTSKSLLLPEVLESKLQDAGFLLIKEAKYLVTNYFVNPHEIVKLDTRQGEFFFMEAKK